MEGSSLGIIFLVIFVVVIAGVGIFAFKMIKKMNGESEGVAKKGSVVKSAQDFLPFANIENDILDLGGFQ